MALLEKIRVKFGIVISVIIALALLSFIIDPGTLESALNSMSSKYDVGKIAGKRISYNEFQSEVDKYTTINELMTGSSAQESLHYKVRLPNIPYRYASFDLGLTWHDLFVRGSVLRLTYDNFWQHDFPLTWENIGDSATKARVPEQFAHNLALSCSLMKGRYNLSLECRNLTDERLYDNFSLQKAGRAFYVKLRVHFGE